MPFKQLEAATHYGRRVLITGPPNSLKTTATLTWPTPRHHISFPGEKGWSTLPPNSPEMTSYVWEESGSDVKITPHSIVTEIEMLTIEVIAGKRGPCTTLALDGLHKLYTHYFERAWLDLGQTEETIGRAYGASHRAFSAYLNRTLQSPVPYIVATVWEGRTKDDPDNKSKTAPTHIFPDLPGEMAKRVVGEFSIVLYAECDPPDPQGRVRARWYTRPQGRIWGAGVKLPPDMAAKVPAKVEPPDYRTLEPYLKPKGA